MILFRNREDAGRRLAAKLAAHVDIATDDPIVLGLPRGGIPVAREVARKLDVPMDIFLVRKLGVPGQEELAMGSIATGGVQVLNGRVIDALNISPATVEQVAGREQVELRRREELYRGNRPQPDLHDRTVVLVDDGLATGASMKAAITAVRQLEAKRVVVAVPVAAPSTCRELERDADEIECAETPEWFMGVGQWYDDFHQMTDEEVQIILEEAGVRK